MRCCDFGLQRVDFVMQGTSGFAAEDELPFNVRAFGSKAAESTKTVNIPIRVEAIVWVHHWCGEHLGPPEENDTQIERQGIADLKIAEGAGEDPYSPGVSEPLSEIVVVVEI